MGVIPHYSILSQYTAIVYNYCKRWFVGNDVRRTFWKERWLKDLQSKILHFCNMSMNFLPPPKYFSFRPFSLSKAWPWFRDIHYSFNPRIIIRTVYKPRGQNLDIFPSKRRTEVNTHTGRSNHIILCAPAPRTTTTNYFIFMIFGAPKQIQKIVPTHM